MRRWIVTEEQKTGDDDMSIRFFDMLAGIGGFRSGLEAVGGFECVGHCEIDKYANQAYKTQRSDKK